MLPKMGLPVALVELAYPSQDWLIEKKKKNAIKVIFNQGAQLTYQAAGENVTRINKNGQKVAMADHIN